MTARRTRRSHRLPLGLLDLECRIAPATFTVTNANNSGTGSLRQAVINANNAAGADLIDFSSFFNSPRTITLASQISITGPVTIDGPSAANVTISGNDAVRIFNTQSAPTGAAIQLVDLTLTSGRVTGTEWGGAVLSGDESISATRCTFTMNSANISSGGAIAAASGGSVTVINSTFTENSSQESGGAILAIGGPVTVTGCEFTLNSDGYGGGAIAVGAGTLTATNCNFTSNSSGLLGGAIRATSVTATDCTFRSNLAVFSGGAIYVDGAGASATFTRCDISNNQVTSTGYLGGGGMHIVGDLTLEASTVSGNSVVGNWGYQGYYPGYGGGMLVQGAATIRNSTISANTASSNGGASANTMLVQNSTITGNSAIHVNGWRYGGGLSANSIAIESSIVANNSATFGPDIRAGSVNARNCAILNRTGIATFNDLGGNRPAGENPRLGPLQDNGGPTKTHLLLPGSPCVNAGSNPANLTTDQRGFARSLNGGVDMGAAEGVDVNPTATATGIPPTITSAGVTSFDIVVRFDDDIGIDLATIDLNDIRVTGPGYATPQAPNALSINGSGTVVSVTYTFPAPGGVFDFFDGGLYTVSMAANQVADLDTPTPHFVAPGTLGSFRVAIPGTLIVDEVSDIDDGNVSSGRMSLREAVRLTNTSFGSADTITFNAAIFGVPRTIALSGGEFRIFDSLTVVGPGSGLLTINATSASRHFFADAGSAVSLSGLTLINGNAVNGGAITNSNAALTLSDLVFSNCAASNAGGAVNSTGPLTMRDCVVNNSRAAGVGGAVSASAVSGDFVFQRCSFVNNSAGVGGGALYLGVNGLLQISECTISGNSAADYYGGGGIHVRGGTPAAGSYIRNSTITGNSCTNSGTGGGLALYFDGTLPIANCTITGNTAQGYGGGIAALGGEFFLPPTIVLQSSIVAGNSASGAADSGPDLYFNATFLINVPGNNNLIGVANSGNFSLTGTGNLTGTLASPLNPLLAPLANNGGPTKTHSLLPGSPALNAGSNDYSLTHDQRGPGFARTAGPRADIGAFEAQLPRVSSVRINDGSAQRSRVTSVSLTFSAPVSFAGQVKDAFTLLRNGGKAVTFTADANLVNGATVVTISNFTGAFTQFDSLADGRYTLTALASRISADGQALDGDGDGLPGGDFTFGEADGLFRLFGDINGDRRVDIADFGLFSITYLNPANFNAAFDVNGDGRIDIVDFGQFSLRYLTPLP